MRGTDNANKPRRKRDADRGEVYATGPEDVLETRGTEWGRTGPRSFPAGRYRARTRPPTHQHAT